MYFMGLSATRFFKHWPELSEEYDSISLHNAWIETFKHDGERMIPPSKVSERLRAQGLDPDTPPGTFQMRPLVYKMFVRQVEKLGVTVQFGKKIVDYYEDEVQRKSYAVSDKGERFEADIIIAADGRFIFICYLRIAAPRSRTDVCLRSWFQEPETCRWPGPSHELRQGHVASRISP
jgi:2-polyprenyl-6-methoxyphenol hydroxylase-like FAD-dependent oxidoreductase